MKITKKSTRYYSTKQEKSVAKYLNGKRVSNSGATAFNKGDVELTDWLIECKTTTATKKASFSIKREWLDKNKEEAFAMGKSYSALCFDFGDGKRHYIIDERTFKQLIEKEN